MKKITILILCLTYLSGPGRVHAQEKKEWPKQSSHATFYVSSLLGIANPIIISYERMKHRGAFHYGYTAGLTTVFYEGVDYASIGPHLTFSAFTGRNKSHFETKLGFAYQPILLYARNGWSDYHFKMMPVISLGYRHQKPGNSKFWRIGISTAGFGFGMGWEL
jgi:hypothetical protein